VRWVEHVAFEGTREEEYRVLWGKQEERKPLLKSRHRWEYIIKIDLKGMELGTMDFSNLAQGPVAGCSEHHNRLLAVIKCSEFID
jgi:hypothetical protein